MRLPCVQNRNNRLSRTGRTGFTLVELLVVIAIIAILMALALGVISKVYVAIDEMRTGSDIEKLSESCNLFKSTFGRYPASRIILCEDPRHYQSLIASGHPVFGPLAAYSAEYLSSVFPGALTSGRIIDWTGKIGGAPSLPAVLPPVVLPPSNAPQGSRIHFLEGQECLVYFLSGIRPLSGSGPRSLAGFNTDKSLPCLMTTGARLGPFYEFDAGRLKDSTNAANNYNDFQTYDDHYGKPYAYFAARTPGMNNYFHPGAPAMGAWPPAASDCFTLTGNYVPLWKTLVINPPNPPTGITYHKADTFQIVSAGKDKLYGCGGRWNQADPEASVFAYMSWPTASVATPLEDRQAVYDNITNVTNGRVVPK